MNKIEKDSNKTISLTEMRSKGFIAENKKISDDHVIKVKNKSGFRNLNYCPVCSSNEHNFFITKSTIDYVTCKNCSCTYPKNIPNNIADIYGGDEYVEEFIEIDGARDSYKKDRFGKERIEILKSQIGDLKGKKLLDVGCGTGWFLELCKEEGLECYGQELGSELAEYTSKRTGIKIFNDKISDISGFDNFFEIIVLFDLIEHLEDPVDFIKILKNKLVEGGIILIFTPNFNSFGISKLKENSSLLIPTDHICLFSPKTLEVFSEKVKMSIDWISYNGIDIGDYLSFLEYENFNLDDALKQRIYDDLQPVIDSFTYSNHFRFILKK